MAQNKIEVVINAKDYASKTIENLKKNTQTNFKEVEQSSKSLSNALMGIGVTFVSVAGIIAGTKSILTIASQNEQAKISFETLLKSGEEAKQMLIDIGVIAQTSPFNSLEITKSTQQLLGFGFTADQAKVSILVLGDAISAVGRGQEDLNGVIMALGQIRAKGKLSMEETLQIAERGLPIFDILRDKLKLTGKQLGDLGNQGIDSATAITAILEGLNEKFAGSMEKQSKTLGGQFANMQDNLQIIAGKIGENISGTAKNTLSIINEFITNNGSQIIDFVSDIYKNVASVFSAVGSVVITTYEIFSSAFEGIAKDGNGSTLTIGNAFKGLFMFLTNGIIAVAGVFEQALLGIEFMVKAIGTGVQSNFNILTNKAKALGSATMALAKGDLESFKSIMGKAEAYNNEMSKNGQQKISEYIQNTANKSESTFKKSLEKMQGNFDDFNNNASIDINKEATAKRLKELQAMTSNLKNIFAGGPTLTKDGGSTGTAQKKQAEDLKKVGETATAVFNSLQTAINGGKDKVRDLTNGIIEMSSKFAEMKAKGVEEINKLKVSFEELKAKGIKEVDELLNKFTELQNGLTDIKSKGIEDIAKRSIEIETRQAEITKELQTQDLEIEKKNQLLAEQLKLENELKLAKGQVSTADIEKAKTELNKSETQKIIDRIALETTAQEKAIADQRILIGEKEAQNKIEQERALKEIAEKQVQLEKDLTDIKTKAEAKYVEMQKEKLVYQSLIAQKMELDNLYFSNFQANIKLQIDETQKAINLLNTLNGGNKSKTTSIAGARADGGSVLSGKTYLVGEKGPELFSPKTSGNITPNNQLGGVNININMGGVNVNNQADENRLVEKMKKILINEARNYNIGIS